MRAQLPKSTDYTICGHQALTSDDGTHAALEALELGPGTPGEGENRPLPGGGEGGCIRSPACGGRNPPNIHALHILGFAWYFLRLVLGRARLGSPSLLPFPYKVEAAFEAAAVFSPHRLTSPVGSVSAAGPKPRPPPLGLGLGLGLSSKTDLPPGPHPRKLWDPPTGLRAVVARCPNSSLFSGAATQPLERATYRW